MRPTLCIEHYDELVDALQHYALVHLHALQGVYEHNKQCAYHQHLYFNLMTLSLQQLIRYKPVIKLKKNKRQTNLN